MVLRVSAVETDEETDEIFSVMETAMEREKQTKTELSSQIIKIQKCLLI